MNQSCATYPGFAPVEMTFYAQSTRAVLVVGLLLFNAGLAAAPGQSGNGFGSVELQVPASGKPGFVRLPPATTGVLFTNRLAVERYLTNQIYLNGSGVAAGDIDGDGRCDVYFCALGGTNALYRNLGGWKFQEIASASGV